MKQNTPALKTARDSMLFANATIEFDTSTVKTSCARIAPEKQCATMLPISAADTRLFACAPTASSGYRSVAAR